METIMRCGDSKEVLKEIQDNSVDMLCTDPPYGYSMMQKSWDKALPDPEIWKECLRVLKPGSFICVMAAPRTDLGYGYKKIDNAPGLGGYGDKGTNSRYYDIDKWFDKLLEDIE